VPITVKNRGVTTTAYATLLPKGARNAATGSKAVQDAITAGAREVIDPDLGRVAENADNAIVTAPTRKMVIGQHAWTWLNSGRGARVVTALKNETSQARIMQLTGGKFDADLAGRSPMPPARPVCGPSSVPGWAATSARPVTSGCWGVGRCPRRC
jgi:hypothetical protein